MPQNIKEMCQYYHKNSCHIPYFTVLFRRTQTCIHKKIFMNYATRTICLDNIGALYNTNNVLRDMGV